MLTQIIECRISGDIYIQSEFYYLSLAQNGDIPDNKKRTTKKGILITILIVVSIVAASFLVYLIP